MKYKIIWEIFFLLVLFMLSACDEFNAIEAEVFEEPQKDLSGVWVLEKVTRNGIEITHLMDFSRFRLDLKEDGSYVIENYLPFVVKEDGQWRVDDPQYPFHLIFKEYGEESEVNVEIKYMVVGGKRSLSIQLSPGCFSNSYIYMFNRTENE
jgi:hypothetical protein